MMIKTLAFDVYGTLIDTAGITGLLSAMVGAQAPLFSGRWREKQLEYSFRRGLMKAYRDFSVCTREALEYTSQALDLPLTNDQKLQLMEGYRSLPAFPDVAEAVEMLRFDGHRLYAFSNGRGSDVVALLRHAGISDLFIDIVSVDEIGSFKPDPAVYHHFLSRADADAGDTWLISGNPFDLLGAAACGFDTAWVRRDSRIPFDPWDREPTGVLQSLVELPALLKQ